VRVTPTRCEKVKQRLFEKIHSHIVLESFVPVKNFTYSESNANSFRMNSEPVPLRMAF
jgi:hypothetical protein